MRSPPRGATSQRSATIAPAATAWTPTWWVIDRWGAREQSQARIDRNDREDGPAEAATRDGHRRRRRHVDAREEGLADRPEPVWVPGDGQGDAADGDHPE